MRAVVDPESIGRYGLGAFRKRRTSTKNSHDCQWTRRVFFTHLGLLNPFRYGLFSWQLVSHKLFRWLTPCAILVLLISNLFLWTNWRLLPNLSWCCRPASMERDCLALAGKSVLRWVEANQVGRLFLVGKCRHFDGLVLFSFGRKIC